MTFPGIDKMTEQSPASVAHLEQQTVTPTVSPSETVQPPSADAAATSDKDAPPSSPNADGSANSDGESRVRHDSSKSLSDSASVTTETADGVSMSQVTLFTLRV